MIGRIVARMCLRFEHAVVYLMSLLRSWEPVAPLVASVRSLEGGSSLPLWVGEPLEESREALVSLEEKLDLALGIAVVDRWWILSI